MPRAPVTRAIAIETSSRSGSAAVLFEGEVRSTELAGGRAHASDLLPLLDGLVREVGLDRTAGGLDRLALDAVFVGTGPGSYTGLRVGIAFALGLVRATGCSIVGIPSTEALAYRELEMGETGAVVQDARAGRFYYARYQRTEDGIDVRSPPCAIAASELCERLAGEDLVLGEDALADAADLPEETRARIRGAGPPEASSVLDLGRRRLEERGPDRPETVRPLYLLKFGEKG